MPTLRMHEAWGSRFRGSAGESKSGASPQLFERRQRANLLALIRPSIFTSVQFGATEFVIGVIPACSESVTGVQQNQTMVDARTTHAAGDCPGTGSRIVERAAC